MIQTIDSRDFVEILKNTEFRPVYCDEFSEREAEKLMNEESAINFIDSMDCEGNLARGLFEWGSLYKPLVGIDDRFWMVNNLTPYVYRKNEFVLMINKIEYGKYAVRIIEFK